MPVDRARRPPGMGVGRPGQAMRGWSLLLVAWLVALMATAGALFIGEVMGMTPCVLCWYQRIFMFPLAIILAIACYSEDRRGAVYALPLAAGGAALATYHTLLVAGLAPKAWIPCGAGVSCADQRLVILGDVQIPWLSLAAFLAILGLLSVYLRKTSK
ncbi:disulfide bond formation protein B [Azohydromonas caseinilytica]|uniref:Disulfide bond formation protein B n=1 Tax=Azohydromonas caseinilytica TaxID=2728836 RepID=A0A848FA78_9BURK|nr:disulfide bond formation protein B [Azohydromonas caseinilytica]NML17067.1 disulfide bond formation protein B [Azohydromonas caseinilytica]